MEAKIKLNQKLKTDDELIKKASEKSGVEVEVIQGEDLDKASPLMHPDKLPAIMRDLEVPSKNKGPFSPIDKERWQNVIEALVGRGVKSSRQAANITGLSHTTCNDFINKVKESWTSDLTPQRVNLRREVLYAENERIADFCWALIQGDPGGMHVPQYLKIIGDTNTRRSRLVGAEQITLAVGKIESRDIDTNMIQTQAAAKLGVSVNALKDLGDVLATKMIPHLDDEEEEEDKENEQV
jgi:hypothetical protein